jgi:predicted amidohydrolase
VVSYQVKITRKKSRLSLNDDGYVELRLIQNLSRRARLGERSGLGRPTTKASQEEVSSLKAQLAQSRVGTLTVMAYDPAVAACKEEIRQRSENKTIIALAGVQKGKNVSYIASDTKLVEQSKISLASEDRKDKVSSGDELYIFESNHGSVSWAVLNCHDYSHADLVRKLQDERIELLVVVAYNAAHKLYLEYAYADMHRLFCFIVIANIGEMGGSGVFAPFRSIGREKNARLSAGGQLFATHGTSAVDVDVPLDIGLLRSLRQKYSEEGYTAQVTGSEIDPIAPPQSFLKTGDGQAVGLLTAAAVRRKQLEWNSFNPQVAFCQLDSLSMDTYLETGYRLDGAETPALLNSLRGKLAELEQRFAFKNPRPEVGPTVPGPDFIVFPEVYIPRDFIPDLQDFSDRNYTIVIAGMAYPKDKNVNDCLVIVPRTMRRGAKRQLIYTYRKLSRSQYDAQRPKHKGRMQLTRGARLLRFENSGGRRFGVLICYDVSHFELVHQINTDGGQEPLDLLFVVSHNPFGDLYRYCCMADAHRFYQHIVMCNVAAYGGSGVFAPTRGPGTRRVLAEVGKGVEAIGLVKMDLTGQRNARAASEEKLHEGSFMRKPGIFQRRIVFIESKKKD